MKTYTDELFRKECEAMTREQAEDIMARSLMVTLEPPKSTQIIGITEEIFNQLLERVATLEKKVNCLEKREGK